MPIRAIFPLLIRVAGLLLLLGAAPAAAGDRPFTIDAMLRMVAMQDVQPSLHGRWIAFTAVDMVGEPEADRLRSRIHVIDTRTGQSRVVTPSRQQCEKPRFAPDGHSLAYLVDGDDVSDVFVVHLETGAMRRLTHGGGDVLNLAWSPEGHTLALTMACPGCQSSGTGKGMDSDVDVLEGAIGVSTGLYLLSPSGNASPRPLVTQREVGDFVFSPDGRHIAFESTDPRTPIRGRGGKRRLLDAAQSDIALVDVRTGVVTPLVATADAETSPRFSPDGHWLAYVDTVAPGFYFNASRIMLVPVDGGSSKALALTPDAHPELLGWSAKGDFVYVREPSRTGAVIWAVPVSGGPPRLLSHTPHVVRQAALSADGRTFGLVLEDSDLPSEVWWTPATPFAPRQLSHLNAAFAAYRMPRTEVVHWTATDGTTLEGLYTHPARPGDKPPAVLVEIHGGPALSSERHCIGALNYYPLAVFAERGYAIFRPNVRGSDGYGPAFRMANRGDWGGVDFADLQSGLDALVARGLADPARLGIMGWSYGGYLAAWAIGHSERFKAASLGAPIIDLVSQAGSMDLPDFIPLYFGGEAYAHPRELYAHSPLAAAGHINTPTLLQHGVEDARVPFEQSMELFTALSRRGVPTTLAAYPRSGHDITEPGLVRDLMTRNVRWFSRFLPPAGPAPVNRLAASGVRSGQAAR